jgi:hypothetical protein
MTTTTTMRKAGRCCAGERPDAISRPLLFLDVWGVSARGAVTGLPGLSRGLPRVYLFGADSDALPNRVGPSSARVAGEPYP